MKFEIDSRIFEKFQGLNIGVVVAKNVNNGGNFEELQKILRQEEERIKASYNTETLSQVPKIDIWRKAYSAFGAKPKENRSSVENLYRMVLQGTVLRHINSLVDIYNIISLKHMLPVGGEDTDRMQGNIYLTFAGSHEFPVSLLGDKEPRPPHEGEVIYKDEISAICRRWNWREADRTKLTEKTENCILVIEGLAPVTKEEIERATHELKEMVQKYCGGKVIFATLNKDKQYIEF